MPVRIFISALITFLAASPAFCENSNHNQASINVEAGSPSFQISLFGQHRIMKTARSELSETLSRFTQKIPDGAHFQLGLFAETPARTSLIRRGLVNLHNVAKDQDAFECLRDGNDVYLLGSTPRGVMQAVYSLEDQLVFNEDIPLDWHTHGVFRIQQRFFHPRFDKWPGERADIQYISRLGASHCLISHDWQGSLRSLQGYVSSPIFPDAVPQDEVARNHEGLRKLISDCKDYGLDMALWITELPCQGGPWVPEEQRQAWLKKFPQEVLSDSGTYQGKVLCFSHPMVQEFYRDLMHRFFSDFPEVDALYLFGMDSGGEGCDPESCPRCRGMSKFEQRDRLIRFLCEEGEKARPGLRVLTTGWHWESMPDEFLERQSKLPFNSGVYLAAESDGWQAERQNHEFLRKTRSICRERGQSFIGYDDFHLGDDATHLWGLDLQDFPLGIGAKIARWHDLDADGVFDHWGAFNEMVPNNSIACREFFLNPLADPETVCHKIAVNQYGLAAGKAAFNAWRSIERAQRILSNCSSWAPGQWPNWYDDKATAVLPDLFMEKANHDSAPLTAKEALGFVYNGGSITDCLEAVGAGWRLAAPHFEDAARQFDEAITKTDDSPIGYAFWWNGAAKPLGRKEHLQRHKIYAEFIGLLGREIGIHFELRALYNRTNHEAGVYMKDARDLLAEDLQACRNIVEFIDRLESKYPEADHFPAHSWKADYIKKTEQLEKSLNGN